MVIKNMITEVNSTAGAVAFKNKKGEISMQKVKVQRYVSGRRPNFGTEEPLPESSEDEIKDTKPIPSYISNYGDVLSDLKSCNIHQPNLQMEIKKEEEDDDDFYEKRKMLRQQILDKKELSDPGSESEFDFQTDSEIEEHVVEEKVEILPKPVFVSKKDRVTLNERQEKEEIEKRLEMEAVKIREEQRQHTLRLIEEQNKMGSISKTTATELDKINSDDEDDEIAYKCWMIRELNRQKADQEELERHFTEKLEIERVHNMTEEQRKEELKKRGDQIVTNKAVRGKMKFMQKYYHRGVFFLDQEDEILKRDVAQPTLEDHFDKTVLPSIMQVKNFGMAGRTKYTHLVDQDTTVFYDSPWGDELKGGIRAVGGIAGTRERQIFARPSAKKKKTV